MFAFTLHVAMLTVTMEILRSSVKHYFLIVFVATFNQTIKKKRQYIVVKKNYVTITWFLL